MDYCSLVKLQGSPPVNPIVLHTIRRWNTKLVNMHRTEAHGAYVEFFSSYQQKAPIQSVVCILFRKDAIYLDGPALKQLIEDNILPPNTNATRGEEVCGYIVIAFYQSLQLNLAFEARHSIGSVVINKSIFLRGMGNEVW